MSSYNLSVNDEDEDALFERIKEESLKYYKEVELAKNQESDINKEKNVEIKDLLLCEESQPISKNMWYEGSEAQGFYLSAGSTYIYPTNYPVREYQENIVRTALFKNTLVSLPTGLGKTFIAAVVMYNFYRWYPKGKIVFMAPTRPLVAQQIKACYNIMGLPIEDTTEMTGNLNVLDRVSLWKDKRVFFLTPQVMVNDIRSKSCPAKLIKCLVVDEAHRAVKDYAYCHVVSLLEEEQAVYRILALSATPGNDVNGVQQIIQNLKISSLEFRGEDAIDVLKYTHQKNVQSVVVNLSINIQRVKGDFLHVYDKYAKRLRECKAMNCNISTVTKFQVLKASEKFRAHPPRGLPPTTVGSIICDFSVCMSLAHALELLQIYGLRAFYSYLSEGGDKNKAAATRLKNDEDLKKILLRLHQMLSKKPGEEGYIWGHPKLFKLTSVLSDHFKAAKEVGEKTKAIIFCQYRVVVTEVLEVLMTLNSDIKPIMFIGQSSNSKDKGMTQAKQLEIMKDFRLGVYNCMIATCVAEEGLDIGEVDLIVLMEAHKSPIRLVQRIGRTGRKRNGKCVVLVTEGREEYKFQEAMAARKSYVSSVLNAKSVKDKLYPNCPSMIPQGIKPTRQLLHIEVIEHISPEKPATSKQVDIRACLVPEQTPFITSEEYKKVIQEIGKKSLSLNQIPESKFLFHRMHNERMPIDELLKKDLTVFSEWNDWNLQLHEIHELSHSSESELMCGLLNRYYTFDVKFFNLSTIREKENKKRKRDNGKMDVDTDEELITTKKGRKTKKEVDKVKFGMDIRHCLAAAKDRLRTQKEFDINEIIDLEAPNNFENNDKLVDEVIQSLEKELNLKDLTTADSHKLNSPFQEITSKIIDSFSFQVKKKEYNMFTILKNLSSNKETLMTSLLSELESLKLQSVVNEPEKEVQEILHPDIFWDNESVTSEKASRKSPDSLVGLDDLLNEGKETGDTTSQKSDNHHINTHPNYHEMSLGVPVNKHLNEKSVVERPITPITKDSEQFWESLPEEFLDFKPSTTPNHSKFLAASTPLNNKVINSVKKASHSKHFSNEIESPIPKTKNDDVWNLDDLFEDHEDFNNKILDNHKASQNSNDSTMIGITQMVSLIEQEKIANKKNKSCNENIILDYGQSKIDKDIATENYQKEIVKDECDKLLLDEDDDFFASIPNIDLTPIKNLPAAVRNVSHDLKNFSTDMFASTMFQSRILDNNRTNEQTRVDEEEPCISPKSKDIDNVKKIDNPGKISEENFITDINDILENDEDSDDCIIISDDERENECLASQRIFLELEASKNQKPEEDNLDNSFDNVMEFADVKENDSLSLGNSKLQQEGRRSCEKFNNIVSITLRSTPNKQENIFFEEINYPIKESTVVEVKINPPNFKRFVSNKNKPASMESLFNSTVQNQSTSSIQPKKLLEPTKMQNIKYEDSNKKVIVEEGWWFDFDFPPSYPKRDVHIKDKPTNPLSILQKKPVPIEVSKTDINSKNPIRKITEFTKPLNKIEMEVSSKRNLLNINSSNDLNANEKEQHFIEPKELPIRKKEHFKLESTVNINCNKINGFINESWDVSDVLSLEKSRSEKNVFITNNSNKKNASDDLINSKNSFEDLSLSKEKTVRKSANTSDSFKNSHKFSSIEISDDEEEIFRDPRSSSRGKSSKENSTEEQRSSNKIRSSSDHKKKRRRRPGCEFISKEAEVSEDDTSSGNDESSGLDDLDESFINDDQENYENMHAKYLQSVKSPIQGKFKIPQKLNTENINVYSQFEANDSEYINDSFCVDSDESTDENDLSAIEIAERKLEKKRKLKKQNDSKPKRRRIRILSPDQTNVLNEDLSLLSDTKSVEKLENTNPLKQKKKFCILSDSEGTASDSSPLLINKKMLSKNKLAKTTLKVNSKKSLNFFTALSNKNKAKIAEDDDDLQKALMQSQQEYLRNKELEDKELLEAIERSKAELHINHPSTSGLSN